jgi:hypothetical protein
VAVIFSGIVCVVAGLMIMTGPVFYSSTYSITIDFSRIKYPLGSAFILVGIYLFYQHKRMQNLKHRIQYWICPQCQDTCVKTGLGGYVCDVCGQDLEMLEGFYERHSNS